MTEEKPKQVVQSKEEPVIRSRVFFKENLNQEEPVIRSRQFQKDQKDEK